MAPSPPKTSRTTPARRDRPVAERVYAATMRLMLEVGLRRLRTAEIARRAGTTESTLFRHFANLDAIIERTYGHAWDVLNDHVSRAAFASPVHDDPVGMLLADTEAIWRMRDDDESSDAAVVAFLFMRRRHEILEDPDAVAGSQRRFEERLDRICASVVAASESFTGDADHTARLLRTLVLNYAATVWLTWCCMPAGSDDLTVADHDLSPGEAQLGVLSLVERAVGVPVDELRGGRRAA